MPTRSEIRDWVRQHTLVEADDYADDKVNNVINQGIRDLSSQFTWPFLQTSTVIDLQTTVASYALPSDFAHLAAAIRDDCACPVVEVVPRDAWDRWDSTADTDKPAHYYMWGGNIVFAPTPVGASLPDVTLYYYREPTILNNDTDSPEFATQFHMVLAEFAAAKVWEREEDLTRSNYYMERYYAGVERMARHYLNRTDKYPLVMGGARTRTTPKIPEGRMPWLEV